MKIEVLRKLKGLLGKGLIRRFYMSLFFLSDRNYIRLIYRLRMGRYLDLENPKTFTEKLQFLKLYDHNQEYTKMADKILMRDYVSARIGTGHTVPIIGVWENFEDIDFSTLPDSFVLKTNNDSGSFFICSNKNSADLELARKTLSRSLRTNYYKITREWQYKNIEPRILAERFLDDGSKCLTDYKFFCFNGKPEFYYVEQETSEEHSQSILDMKGNRMSFTMEDYRSDSVPEKPRAFEEMVSYAEALSEGIPFLRVDMYYVNGNVYIGELTFYHFGGFIPFNPPEWDAKLGEKLAIDKIVLEKR